MVLQAPTREAIVAVEVVFGILLAEQRLQARLQSVFMNIERGGKRRKRSASASVNEEVRTPKAHRRNLTPNLDPLEVR
jgi:hypothetical protein